MSIDAEPLRQFKDKHKGQDCVLLANGTTLNNAKFEEIPKHVISIGMNSSWTNHWSDYLVACDRANAEVAANYYGRLQSEGRVPEGCKGPEVFRQLGHEGRLFVWGVWPTEYKAYTMQRQTKFTRPGKQIALPFSRDIAEGVQLGIDGFGAVSYVALQVAVTMGFSRIFWLGLDLGFDSKHHHGWTPSDPSRMVKQNVLFETAQREALEPLGIKCYVVNSPNSLCTVWPRISWKEFLEMAHEKA